MTPEFGYDERYNLLRISFIGVVNVDSYEPLADFVNPLPPEMKMSYLAGVSKIDGSLWSKETREVVAGKMERVEGSRIAIIGVSAFMRILTKTIASAMGNSRIPISLKMKQKRSEVFMERRKK